jgi:hypothetical protein
LTRGHLDGGLRCRLRLTYQCFLTYWVLEEERIVVLLHLIWAGE